MIISKKSKKTPVLALFALSIAMVTGLLYVQQSTTSAADVSKFDPGNIMSDATMSNKSTMNVQQIQAFLNSKNRCNNTNIHIAKQYPHLRYTIRDGKFVCMAQDTFGGKSAAQIIWQVAQDYSINPQFLIVLLEKEQGLISDTWPNNVQYRTATGFGCPDTAPCDSQYFGLENQLRQAANLFRNVLNGGWSNYPVGRTFVQYNPSAACGGSIINIQNRATSALYRYTPYQPNRSALNAGYGTGDSCGAYGNRNTWMLFNDWFGSTQGSSFVSLDTPRWMEVNAPSAQKIDIFSGQKINEPLEEGRQIRFVDKALYGNTWYLRSEFNYKDMAAQGIPQKEVRDIAYESIPPQWIMINSKANKSHPASRTTTGENLERGHAIKVTQKITIDNNTYYRSAFDTSHKLDKGIHSKFTSSISPISLEKPRDFCANKQVAKLDPLSGAHHGVTTGNMFRINKKIKVDNTWYFQLSEDNGTQKYVNSTELRDSCFVSFEQPRSMKLNKNVNRINIRTGSIYDSLSRGQIVSLSTKIYMNNQWYYRTTHNTKNKIDAIIPASSFSEL